MRSLKNQMFLVTHGANTTKSAYTPLNALNRTSWAVIVWHLHVAFWSEEDSKLQLALVWCTGQNVSEALKPPLCLTCMRYQLSGRESV